ncbi:MAG: hypothetical protein JNJ80_09235 [Gemmatimonadetes bacterium]|nr:hypothetical protein [Gemmatimonadota bacterium]
MTAGLAPNQDNQRTSQPADGQLPTNYVTGIADGNLATPVRLRDYLTGVGVVFRLPKRDFKQERADAKAAEAAKFRVNIPVRKILMVLAPLAVAAVGYTAWENWLSSVPLPSEVSGTWTTNDGKYAGRNFWVNQNSVAFQNGKTTADFSVHPIKRIKSRTAADTLFLTIDYEQDDKPITLSLAYRATPSPEIRLVNQPQVKWYRAGNAPVIDP